MTFFGREDKFDELRRAWIAHHQGWSTIQRRRAEQLGRRVRARQRDRSSAVPDPHDDTTLPPMWLRTAKSPAAQLELMAVLVAVAVVPLGWPGGIVFKAFVTRSIPGTLRGYPITALLCSGAGLTALCAVLTAVSDPGRSFTQAVGLPWSHTLPITLPRSNRNDDAGIECGLTTWPPAVVSRNLPSLKRPVPAARFR